MATVATGGGEPRVVAAAGVTRRGTAGNDVLYGDAADDIIFGLEGSDKLNGGAGSDALYGGDGNDTLGLDYYPEPPGSLHPRAYSDIDRSPDILNGGNGDDTIRAGWGDTVIGGSGFDTLSVDFASASEGVVIDFNVLVAGRALLIGGVTLNGIERIGYQNRLGAFDDRVVSATVTGQYIAIDGNSGNDIILGNAGVEQLDGNSGDDSLDGKQGDDQLHGGYGNDLLVGGEGDDVLVGHEGRDQLYGGSGNDRLGQSYVAYNYSPQDDYAYDYTVFDIDAVPDILSGGDGDDIIYAGWGDAVDGGAGSDTLRLDFRMATEGIVANFADLTAGGSITVGGALLTGIEHILARDGYDYEPYAVQLTRFDDRIVAGAAATDEPSAYIDAGDGDDFVVGNIGAERISGGKGDDRVRGGGGGDGLSGLEGNDSIDGGTGDDFIGGQGGDDRLLGGTGDDWLDGFLGDDRIYGGAGADKLMGGAGDDVLYGGQGADRLYGEGGEDRLNGDDGDDVLSVGSFGDTTTLIGGAGADRFVIEVQTASRYNPVPTLRILDFSHAAGDVIDVSGGSGRFAFIGTAAFHNVANEVRYETANGHTAIHFDVDGNGRADLTIRLPDAVVLVAADFVL